MGIFVVEMKNSKIHTKIAFVAVDIYFMVGCKL